MTSLVQAAGWALVHFVWQGALIALVIAAALRFLRDASPNARYVVACTGLAAMLAAPLLTAGVQETAPPIVLHASLDRVDPTRRTALTDRSGRERTIVLSPAERSVEAGWTGPVARRLPMVVMIWLTGVLALGIRLMGGWWRVRALERQALTLPASNWHARATQIAERVHLRRAFHLVDAACVDSPTVVGWLRPVVLLPIGALTNLTPSQIDAILAHELAHIRRHDYLANLVQTIAETLLFYHPAVWWLSARIRIEREQCCDDVAVGVTGDAAAYAAALTELETRRSGAALALAATGAGGPLVSRVRRLLTIAPGETPSSHSSVLVIVIGAALLVGYISRGAQPVRGAQSGDIVLRPAPSVVHVQVGRPFPPPPPPPAPPAPRTTWRVEETDHFLVTAEASAHVDLARIGREAERIYTRLASDLRTDLSGRPTLSVFATRGDLQRALASGLVQPARETLGQILVTVDVSDDRLRRDLATDLTRTFAAGIVPVAGTTYPFWLHDGLSQHETGMWDSADAAALTDLVSRGAVPRISRLIPAAPPAEPRLPTVLGHAAFDFIEARWGKDGVRRFLDAARRSSSSTPSLFEAAFALTPDDFDRAFEQYLVATFGAASARPAPRQTSAMSATSLKLLSMDLTETDHLVSNTPKEPRR